MDTRRAALLFGIVFLVVGILGFVPGVNQMHHGDPASENLSVGGPGHGNLFGLFHVNVLHNAVHLLFGVWGVLAARTFAGAKSYLNGAGAIYLLLAICGYFIPDGFGIVPIGGADVGLHALLGVVLLGAGFATARSTEAAAQPRGSTG